MIGAVVALGVYSALLTVWVFALAGRVRHIAANDSFLATQRTVKLREYVDQEIAKVYLTADDRKMLGLPEPTSEGDIARRYAAAEKAFVQAETDLKVEIARTTKMYNLLVKEIETAKKAASHYQNERRSMAQQQLACEKHRWAPSVLERPRRPRSRMELGGDGNVYCRVCVDCGHRQVKLWYHSGDRWVDD